MVFPNLDGHTQLVGLIGWPVAHSLSPAMHNAVFEALELNWCYVPLPVRPYRVATAVSGLTALGFRGINVTVPHKQTVIPLLSTIAPNATALGAANTLVFDPQPDGDVLIHGYNTDDVGAVDALRRGGFELQDDASAVVVGAGGAARAVIFGLLTAGLREITVLNRTQSRAEALVMDLTQSTAGVEQPGAMGQFRALPLTQETLIDNCREADLLINATTVGMWPQVQETIWPEHVPLPSHLTVFDLVYNPLETHLLAQARRAGAQAIDGLEMLVQQGILALKLWVDEIDLDTDEVVNVMRRACRTRLRGAEDRLPIGAITVNVG